MRIVCISDTHNKRTFVEDSVYIKLEDKLPEAEVLVHSGDFGVRGTLEEAEQFGIWLSSISYKYKKIIVIAGNHDWSCARNRPAAKEAIEFNPKVKYLQDEEIVIDGVKFYGSPWQPEFGGWAFNLPRGERLARVWENIPDDTDVLITHGPPRGFQDYVIYDNESVGCDDLLKRVLEVKPMLHVFGHIHCSYGTKDFEGITFCNASICDERYEPVNPPQLFYFDPITGKLDQLI